MNKDKKEELKKLFSIIDEKKFLRFAKSYACKNEDFADAIVAFFLPENKPIDYKKSIAECFAHKKKGRVASWKLHFDWAVIRREARRVMKQLQMIADGGDYAAAIDGALLFLETLCKYFMDDKFAQKEKIQVTFNGRPVRYLNELEYIDGKIWANVYTSDEIVIINPKNGEVEGIINCRGLLPDQLRTSDTDVLNGIAYNPKDGKIYLTGKNWPRMYEIRLKKRK